MSGQYMYFNLLKGVKHPSTFILIPIFTHKEPLALESSIYTSMCCWCAPGVLLVCCWRAAGVLLVCYWRAPGVLITATLQHTMGVPLVPSTCSIIFLKLDSVCGVGSGGN